MAYCATNVFYNYETTFPVKSCRMSFDIAECKKLKDLIIKYAGEKYICE